MFSNSGKFSALQLSAGDKPVVLYLVQGFVGYSALSMVVCNTALCSSDAQRTTINVPTVGTVADKKPGLLLDPLGNPLILYSEFYGGLYFLACRDRTCQLANAVSRYTTLLDDKGGEDSFDVAMMAGASQLPAIAFTRTTNGRNVLMVVECADLGCRSRDRTVVLRAAPPVFNGVFRISSPSLDFTAAGDIAVGYVDSLLKTVNVAVLEARYKRTGSTANAGTVSDGRFQKVDLYTLNLTPSKSAAANVAKIRVDRRLASQPFIAAFGNGTLWQVNRCTAASRMSLDQSSTRAETLSSVKELSPFAPNPGPIFMSPMNIIAGLGPMVVFTNVAFNGLKLPTLVFCNDLWCWRRNVSNVALPSSSVLDKIPIPVMQSSSPNPLLIYPGPVLQYCGNLLCTGPSSNVRELGNPKNAVGVPLVRIRADQVPVFIWSFTNLDKTVTTYFTRCNDISCSSHFSSDLGIVPVTDVIRFELDADERPVVVFKSGSSLQLLRCTTEYCTVHYTTTLDSATALVGDYDMFDMALVRKDLLAVAYVDRLLHPALLMCQNSDCTFSSRHILESNKFTSCSNLALAIDSAGRPAVAYQTIERSSN